MKKFLVTLLVALMPIIVFAQETEKMPPIPTRSQCSMNHGNQQENDYCDEWAAVITASEFLRFREAAESGLLYVVMANYDEATEVMSVSLTQVYVIPSLGNLTLMIWQTLIVGSYDDMVSIQEKRFNESIVIFGEWAKFASKVFEDICPPCDDGGIDSSVMASVTNR